MLKNISKVSSNIKPYTSKDIRRFLTGNNLIDGFNSNLKEFAEKFYDINPKKSNNQYNFEENKKLFLGRINDNISSQIDFLLNSSKRFSILYNTKDTNIVISSDNIKHIYNHHGNETRRGQISVTPEKLAKYGVVISNPDYIGLSSQISRGNTPILLFAKKINGYSVVVEVLSTKKQLYPQSYYIFASNSSKYKKFIENNKLKKAENVESNDKDILWY